MLDYSEPRNDESSSKYTALWTIHAHSRTSFIADSRANRFTQR